MNLVEVIKVKNGYFTPIENDVIYIDEANGLRFSGQSIMGHYNGFSYIRDQIWTYNNTHFQTEVYSYSSEKIIYSTTNFIGIRADLDMRRNDRLFGQSELEGKMFWVDIDNFEIVETYPIDIGLNGIWKILPNKRFISVKEKIISLSLLDAEEREIWRETMEGDVRRVEVWNCKVIIISISSTYESEITALDLDTGRIIWKRDKMSSNFQIQGDYIYCFRKEAFYCINIQDGGVEYAYNLFEKFQTNNFDETTNMLVKGEYLYFSGIMDCVISMWELRTGNLVWYHRLYPKEQTGRWQNGLNLKGGIQISGNRLYQLDSSNTLHVFESEVSLEHAS